MEREDEMQRELRKRKKERDETWCSGVQRGGIWPPSPHLAYEKHKNPPIVNRFTSELVTAPPRSDEHFVYAPGMRYTECPKINRKSVLHLLKHTEDIYLSRCSTDLRLLLGHSVVREGRIYSGRYRPVRWGLCCYVLSAHSTHVRASSPSYSTQHCI